MICVQLVVFSLIVSTIIFALVLALTKESKKSIEVKKDSSEFGSTYSGSSKQVNGDATEITAAGMIGAGLGYSMGSSLYYQNSREDFEQGSISIQQWDESCNKCGIGNNSGDVSSDDYSNSSNDWDDW